ncbi:MAG TPA: DNA polymerase III subunit beta [Patescibacteria group bacterium]|nr:DNA polymerase III subunit beta [Patescibacteria group bacterium]
MKLILLAENLQKKLSFVTHAISSKSQLPILSHILLDAREDFLYVSATDLEIGIEVKIPAQIEEVGATTVPAKLFLELISSLPQEKITLQTEGNNLEVIGKKTKSLLQTASSEEFPSLYEDLGQAVVTFAAKEAKHLFSQVVFSASVESTRPALSGVLLKKTPEETVVVATDGYRLSLERILQQNSSENYQVIIPARVIKEVISLDEEKNISFHISSHNNQIVFSQEDVIIVGRLIESEFPQYQKIIPQEFATKVTVDRDALFKAVKTSAIFARETTNIIRFSIFKEKMIISAKTPSLGENTVDIDSQLEGEENEIAFNARYLIDALSHIEAEQLVFEMTGPLNPGVFKIANNNNFLHLIMPIRTQG